MNKKIWISCYRCPNIIDIAGVLNGATSGEMVSFFVKCECGTINSIYYKWQIDFSLKGEAFS